MPDSVLKLVSHGQCQHNKFEVDPTLNYVSCGLCGENLNPMWVLARLCSKESRFNLHLEYLEETVEKADKKNRCKCEHCKKMTQIQRP